MGWWAEDKMTIGDGPIDRMIHALEQVREEYRTELDREPTHAEVARFTEIALRSVLDTASDNARVDAKIKITAKLTKKQRVAVGDVFVIKLEKCHFGRIVLMEGSGTYIELYRQTADRPLPLRQLDCSRENVKTHKWVFPNLVFEDFRWKVIVNVPVPKDYEFPLVLYGSGDTLCPQTIGTKRRKFFPMTHAEIKKRKLEPHVVWGAEVYEKNLREGNEDPWPEMVEALWGRGMEK